MTDQQIAAEIIAWFNLLWLPVGSYILLVLVANWYDKINKPKRKIRKK